MNIKKYLVILFIIATGIILYSPKVGKKHVLFIVGGGSHIHPTFELVKELINNHAQVTYLLYDKTSDEATKLRTMGATVVSLPEELLAINKNFNDEQRNILHNPSSNFVDQPEGASNTIVLSQYFMAQFWDELVTLTKNINPDVIVYDAHQGYWGEYVARALNVPAFMSFAPAFYFKNWKDPQFADLAIAENQKTLPATPKRVWAADYLRKKLGPIGQDINVDFLTPVPEERYAIFIYTYPQLAHYNGERCLGTNLVFTGYSTNESTALNETEQHIIDTVTQFKHNKKLIFISMGTDSSKPIEFFTMLGQALGNGGKNKKINADIVVALHPGDKIARNEEYDAQAISTFMQQLGHTNFIVYDYFPLPSLFNITDLFIGHGGHNSSMQALHQYIPMILLPIYGDQLLVGETFQDFGFAQTIPLDINPLPFKDNFAEWHNFASSNKRTEFVHWLQTAVKNILTNPEQQKESITKKQYIDSLLQTNQGYEKAVELIMNS